ncbi:MAG: shikimate kinase [Caldilineaceae bacterium]
MTQTHTDANITLTGFMGTGKTTIGRLLAEKLDRPFVDMDEQLEAHFGKTIAEVFAAEGEEVFRTAEAQLCSQLSQRSGLVIATGGGVDQPCQPPGPGRKRPHRLPHRGRGRHPRTAGSGRRSPAVAERRRRPPPPHRTTAGKPPQRLRRDPAASANRRRVAAHDPGSGGGRAGSQRRNPWHDAPPRPLARGRLRHLHRRRSAQRRGDAAGQPQVDGRAGGHRHQPDPGRIARRNAGRKPARRATCR